MRVIQGAAAERRTTPLEEAYAHFRLDRQGLPVSPATLRLYEHTIGRFLRWVRSEHPEVRRFEDLDVVVVRQYRADLAARPGLRGKPIQPETLSGSDRALRTFFRWASAEGYPVAPRILALPKVRVPWKEPTLFHVRQLREILAACNPKLPQEALAVRLLVGAGVRRLELCGLAIEGPRWPPRPEPGLARPVASSNCACAERRAPRACGRAASRWCRSWGRRSSATWPGTGRRWPTATC